MPTTKTPREVADGLRVWAKGVYPLEAGVELLIRALGEKAIYDGAPWLVDYGAAVEFDVDRFLAVAGAWSGGEQRVARIATSLLGGDRVDLHEDVAGLDRAHLDLVLAAIAHANGSHEHSKLRYNPDGSPAGFERAQSLYPWPPAGEAR